MRVKWFDYAQFVCANRQVLSMLILLEISFDQCTIGQPTIITDTLQSEYHNIGYVTCD